MILNPTARVRVLTLSGGQYIRSFTALGLLEPSSLRGIVHWVPEQLNIKAVTGACKLIDG